MKIMNKQPFQRGTVNNIRLHVLPTDRFKTYAVSVYIGRKLEEDTVTSTALIPFVLRRGTERLPETKQFRERLDHLYGAGFGFDIYKRGDAQMVQFRMDTIQDQFVHGANDLLKETISFIGEALTRPALEGGAFRTRYVEAEKATLQKRIEAVVNDKIRYAAERCIEEMCKDEPYRLYPLGKLADLASIDANLLYGTYRDWLASSPMDIYVSGNTTLEQVLPLVEAAFPLQRQTNAVYGSRIQAPKPVEPRTVTEHLEVKQGKLNMGLRTYTGYSDPDYPAALMYNGIFGAFPHSKLFLNVREKASLAYYASSRLDGHKGILTIQSGIELDNFEKADAIIKEQLQSMKDGQYSELEMSQTKAMIVNQLRELQDSAFETIAFDFNSVLSGKERQLDELIQQIQDIRAEDIQCFAQKVQLDTIYFLRN